MTVPSGYLVVCMTNGPGPGGQWSLRFLTYARGLRASGQI